MNKEPSRAYSIYNDNDYEKQIRLSGYSTFALYASAVGDGTGAVRHTAFV